MTNRPASPNDLPTYRVRAVNTSPDSENRIHDDEIAPKYGFHGGLVPGVTVYGYMTVPLVERFSNDWLAHGSMQLRLHRPFYEGDLVVVSIGEVDHDAVPVQVTVTAAQQDGSVCATGLATIAGDSGWLGKLRPEELCGGTLPEPERRPVATRGSLTPGLVLGELIERFDSNVTEPTLTRAGEKLPLYYGPNAVAHPSFLLGLSNHLLMRNFKLGPWIHTASDVINFDVVRNGSDVVVRGCITDCYERKGHEFVELDILVLIDGEKPAQQVHHVVICQLRER
jgi:hypothetical protein